MLPSSRRQRDLRSVFAKLAFAPGDDDEDDGSGDGSSGAGADGTDDDDSTGSADDSSDAIRDPEKKRLSVEAAKRRLEAKQAAKERDEARAELQKLLDKDKSENDILKRDNETMKVQLAERDAIIQEQGLRLAFYDSGAAALLNRPAQAARLMDKELSDLKPDEDGQYDSKELLKIVNDWLKENSHFAATADSGDDDEDERPASGRPLNAKKKKTDASQTVLKTKYPALNAR